MRIKPSVSVPAPVTPRLVPDPTVLYTSPAATATLQLVPATNALGTALVTVTVEDDGGTEGGGQDTFSRSFQVTIVPAQIALQIVRELDGRVALLWPCSAGSLVVQAKSDIRPTTPWQRLPGTPQIVGDHFKLVVPVNSPAQFFRLAQTLALPAAPRLQLLRQPDGRLVLLWPQEAADYLLEFTEALPADTWSPVVEPPQLVDGQFRLTLRPTGPAKLFRLRLP